MLFSRGMESDAYRLNVSESLFFKGRPHDPRIGEWVVSGPPLAANPQQEQVLLWGCPDDTGVLRNHGRAGAKLGPDNIRKHFYRMAMPMDLVWENALSLHDMGNLVPGNDIRETHERCSQSVGQFLSPNSTLIALGGGHDFAAPNFSGFVESLQRHHPKAVRVGLVNIDPHLDVRELEDGLAHSGTPFRQLLESGVLHGRDLVAFGTKTNRNSRAHFKYCQSKAVTVHTIDHLRAKKQTIAKLFRETLHNLGTQKTHLGVTFDMDACSDAEGTSAAPVLGFSTFEMCRMAELAGRHLKVRYFEIAEVAPPLDPFERSSRIAAEMIAYFLRGRAEALFSKKK